MCLLTGFQEELAVSYGKLAVVSVDPPKVNAAFRAGLGARFPFLSDADRSAIQRVDIVDGSDTVHGPIAIPYTFTLLPDLTIHQIYCGWWYVGRPTVEELRKDLREMLRRSRPDFDPQARTPEP